MYINLERRTDRRNDIEGELDKFGLPYERFNAIPNAFGIVGCGYSHLGVLKLAKERNYKNILILEDDFTFIVSKDEFENQLTKFFETVPNYDVCMISYNMIKDEPVEGNDLVKRVIEAQTASGYIVNAHYYDKLIKLYEWAIPILERTHIHWIYANDQVWKQVQIQDKWYYLTLRIGKQRPGYSDNTGKFESLDC